MGRDEAVAITLNDSNEYNICFKRPRNFNNNGAQQR